LQAYFGRLYYWFGTHPYNHYHPNKFHINVFRVDTTLQLDLVHSCQKEFRIGGYSFKARETGITSGMICKIEWHFFMNER
jgi:hypothetical protein